MAITGSLWENGDEPNQARVGDEMTEQETIDRLDSLELTEFGMQLTDAVRWEMALGRLIHQFLLVNGHEELAKAWTRNMGSPRLK